MVEENDVLYKYMNWGAMEALVYSEHDDPHSWLGPHETEEGTLVNAFLPTARAVGVVVGKTEYPMTSVDDSGNHIQRRFEGAYIRSLQLSKTDFGGGRGQVHPRHPLRDL